jgi:chemotaxis protein MotB
MTTFADLMTLLLCFFVLLLSFSEMDRKKFKIISGSLKEAFGVQRSKPHWDMPKGTSLLTQDFSDPRFEATFLVEVVRAAVARMNFQGNVRIKEDEVSVTVILPNNVLFESGSADLKEAAGPILDEFRLAIESTPHHIMVVGHTDDVPIKTGQFPSNWELSAARAGAVIRHFLKMETLPSDRFSAVGKSDTNPVAPNDSPENRSKNRRVEIVFKKNLAVQPIPDAKSDRRRRVIREMMEPEGPQTGPMRRWYW